MNTKIRAVGLLGALAIAVAACSSGGATPSPVGEQSGRLRAGRVRRRSRRARLPRARRSAARLTLWHSYGSGAGTEAGALKDSRPTRSRPPTRTSISRSRTSSSTTCSRSSSSKPPAAAVPTCSSPRTTASARKPAPACSSTSRRSSRASSSNDSDVSVEGSKVDGKLYMVPESLKAVAMYYDKSKVATPPTTTDELLQAVKDGKIKAGFDAHSSYHSFGWWAAFGGKLMDDDGQVRRRHDRRGGRLQVLPGPPDRRRHVVRQVRRPRQRLQVRQDRPDRRRPVGVGRLQGGARRQPRRRPDAGRSRRAPRSR